MYLTSNIEMLLYCFIVLKCNPYILVNMSTKIHYVCLDNKLKSNVIKFSSDQIQIITPVQCMVVNPPHVSNLFAVTSLKFSYKATWRI